MMHLQRIENTLKISGEINMLKATREVIEQFNHTVDSTLEIIDFESVTSADSLGVSMILSALRKKEISLINLPLSIKLLINLYELDSFVTNYEK